MRDLDTVKDMLTRAKIEHQVRSDRDGTCDILISPGQGPTGFSTIIDFNKDGSLRDISGYE